MFKQQNKRSSIVVFLLFVITPFVTTYENADMAQVLNANMLPSVVSEFASALRWILLFVMIILSVTFLTKFKEAPSAPVYLLTLFYFIQFLYAFIDSTDYLRFFLLTIFSFFIPYLIGQILKRNQLLLRYFSVCILFFIGLSLLLNYNLILSGQRFFGFMSNANTLGISSVFWLLIVLLADRFKLIGKRYFVFLIITIVSVTLFTGSRNALLGIALLSLANFYNQIGKLSRIVVVGIIVFYILITFIDLSFVVSRFENILESTRDSGRQDIWESAYFMIDHNLWWGNGMDANMEIADTGNMHNCYIRFVLNMGLFMTILVMLAYFGSILATVFSKKRVPLILPAYLIVYALMNFGEDFFVGVGSVATIYLLFVYGFINYFITKKDAASR